MLSFDYSRLVESHLRPALPYGVKRISGHHKVKHHGIAPGSIRRSSTRPRARIIQFTLGRKLASGVQGIEQ